MASDHRDRSSSIDLELKAISDQISSLAKKCLSQTEIGFQDSGRLIHENKTSAQDPIWLAEVMFLKNSGKIPDYRGCKKDGDAYEFYLRYY